MTYLFAIKSTLLSAFIIFDLFSTSDSTPSPLMGTFSHFTPITEIDDSPIQTNHDSPVAAHQQKQMPVACLKLTKAPRTTEKPICSPLVDTSTSTDNKDHTEATKQTAASDETMPLSSVVAAFPVITDALQVTAPSCKSTSDVSPRQSAYKEPNDHRVHKKAS